MTTQQPLPKIIELTERSTMGGVFTYNVRFANMTDTEQDEAEQIAIKHGWSTSTFWTAPDPDKGDTAVYHDMRKAGFQWHRN